MAESTQPKYVLQGYVRDKTTKLPNANATVVLEFITNKTCTTDQNGYFKFDIDLQFIYYIHATGKDFYSPRYLINSFKQDTVNIILETKPGGKVNVKVVDSQKEPIENALISYNQERNNTGSAKTDKDGMCIISSLDPDATGNISVTAQGYTSDNKQIEFPTGKREINITFQLNTTAVDTTDTRNKIIISGDVRDKYYKAIVGAKISNTVNERSGGYMQITTDSNGHFEFDNIYTEKDGTTFHYENLLFFARATGHAPDWKLMNSADDTVLHFVLQGAHVTGGIIQDEDKNPLPNTFCHFEVLPKLDKEIKEPWKYTYSNEFSSDSEGNFKVNDLPEGEVKFGFFKAGYTLLQSTTLPLDKEDNVITLVASSEVAGKVIDDITGNPINGFYVNFGPSTTYFQKGRGRGVFGNEKGLWYTPEDGKFSLTNLEFAFDNASVAEPYLLVSVDAEGYMRETKDMVPFRTPPIQERDRIIFRMKKLKPTQGIVIDNQTGKAVPGVIVRALINKEDTPYNSYMSIQWDHKQIKNANYNISRATTDGNGRFVLNNLSIPEGMISLEKSGYGRTGYYPVTFSSFVELKLPHAGSITGIFGNSDNFSKDSININLYKMPPPIGMSYEQKTVNAEGKVVYSDLPPGIYTFGYSKKGTGTNQNVTLAEGQNLVLDLSSTASIKITGTVRWKGAPVSGSYINANMAETQSQSVNSNSVSDSAGRYEIQLSVPGTYKLYYSKWDETGRSLNISKTLMVSTGDYRLDINFPDSSIKGLLMNSKTGKPISHTAVSVYQKKKGEETSRMGVHFDYASTVWNLYKAVTTNENGIFGITDMESGQWIVGVNKNPGMSWAGKSFQLNTNQNKEDLVMMLPEMGRLQISVLDVDSGTRLVPIELSATDSSGYVYKPEYSQSTNRWLSVYNSLLPIVMDTMNRVLYSSIPVGSYRILARTDEHYSNYTDINVLSGQTTQAILQLKKSGRLIFTIKEKKEFTREETIICNIKILQAKNGNPILQDGNGYFRKIYFWNTFMSQDTCFVPLPDGEYTVEVVTNYWSQNKSNVRQTPTTKTKLIKIENGKDVNWETSIAEFRK